MAQMNQDFAEPLTHAGGVVFRQQSGGTRYLVVSSSDQQNWVLPKGHIDPGEDADTTARRELLEEAGILGATVAALSVQRFSKGAKAGVIQYFLIRETGEAITDENRTIRWEDKDTALALLSFPEARAALLEGIAVLESNS